MTKVELQHIWEFLDEVEALMEADIDGYTWELEDHLLICKEIIRNELEHWKPPQS